MTDHSKWVLKFHESRTAQLRLFCFPFAGGAASAFKHFSPLLPDWVEIFAIQYPGRETRWAETPCATAGELSDAVAAGIDDLLDEKPFVFFGHSLGALISFEVARRLRAARRPQPRRLFLSARRAPPFAPAPPTMSGLDDPAFKERLLKFNGTPPAVLESSELMSLLMPMLRADFAVDEDYRLESGEPLWQEFSIYGGETDAAVPEEQLRAWSAFTSGAAAVHIFPGDHFFLKDPASPLFEVLSRELACTRT